ncbi:hypothetical protein pb186bvf_003640 [Paramecium bursaria]
MNPIYQSYNIVSLFILLYCYNLMFKSSPIMQLQISNAIEIISNALNIKFIIKKGQQLRQLTIHKCILPKQSGTSSCVLYGILLMGDITYVEGNSPSMDTWFIVVLLNKN